MTRRADDLREGKRKKKKGIERQVTFFRWEWRDKESMQKRSGGEGTSGNGEGGKAKKETNKKKEKIA